jgi:Ni/Fe-hydrogenase subunit HybB-like protein
METLRSLDTYRQQTETRALAPLRRTGSRYYAVVGVLVAIVAWGMFAYSTQLRHGLIVTGMRDRISWGFYITLFVFFIGISHAGTLISAILRVTNAGWRTPITRMAEFITVVALMVGGLMPLVDLGRPDRVLNLLRYGRWQSPIVWDVLSITTYLTGSIIYLYLPLIPDLALCRDRLGSQAPRWKRAFFGLASLGWRGTPGQKRCLKTAIGMMMVLIIPIAVSVHTVVSWIFAMTLREPWNNPMFGAYFVAGAIFSGVAVLILLMALLRRIYRLEEYLTASHFVNLGYILAAFTLIMLYFNASEYVTTGYKMNTEVAFHFTQLFGGGLGPFYWFYLFGGLVLPGLLVLLPWTRNVTGIVVAALFVSAGMWVERYFIVVGGLSVPLMPYAPATYAPTWVEWSIMGGAFALFALIIAFFVKLFPIIAVWEVIEHHEAEPVVAARPVPLAAGSRAILLLIFAVLATIGFGSDAARAEPHASELALEAYPLTWVGQSLPLQAHLTGSGPLPGAVVSFYSTARFQGVSAEVKLGEAITDARGTATLDYAPRREGDVTIEARYAGNQEHGSSRATATLTVKPGSQLYQETPAFRASGIVWILLALLASVWTTYLVVVGLLALIAHEGSTETAP